jgi:hypothetical protein
MLWFTNFVAWWIAAIVTVVVLIVFFVYPAVIWDVFGHNDDGGSAVNVRDKCQNGYLVVNNCQPAPAQASTNGAKCPNGYLASNNCQPTSSGQQPNQGGSQSSGNNGSQGSGSGGSFNPYPFYSQSCSPNETCIWDIGTMGSLDFNGQPATQVGIVKGVSISWNGQTAPNFGGRCSLVVLTPNSWFENLTTSNANVTVYNVSTKDVAGWLKTLAVQAAQEQAADYKCPQKKFEDIPQWGSTIPSPPCGVSGFNNCGGSNDQTQPSNQGGQQSNAQPAPTAASSCSSDTVDCKPRAASVDSGGQANFVVGDAVYGFKITIGGQTYPNCWFKSAPGAGNVVDGVVHPWNTEVAGKQAC